jgi:hypothetical protein
MMRTFFQGIESIVHRPTSQNKHIYPYSYLYFSLWHVPGATNPATTIKKWGEAGVEYGMLRAEDAGGWGNANGVCIVDDVRKVPE